LRQVIINTHSPKLIESIPEDTLYLACEHERYDNILDLQVRYTTFSVLPFTKKAENSKTLTMPLNEMKGYLDGVKENSHNNNVLDFSKRDKKNRTNYTVRDNINYQLSLFNSEK
jgi:hypothetical protein